MGGTAAELQENRLWFKGPKWLSERSSSWPLKHLSDLQPTKESLEEIRSTIRAKVTTETTSLQIAAIYVGVKLTELLDPTQFSNCGKFYRITGYMCFVLSTI